MTGNEIIKALEWCGQFENNIVFKGSGDERCVQALQMMVVIKHALREYNRQKAEIEELGKYKHDYYVLKSEARKEFVERLKEKSHPLKFALNSEVDNLLAEMESERK